MTDFWRGFLRGYLIGGYIFGIPALLAALVYECIKKGWLR